MQHEIVILDDDDYDLTDELAPHYDVNALREAARAAGLNPQPRLIRLAPDVAAVFPNEEAVNQALRELIAARATHKSETQSSTQ